MLTRRVVIRGAFAAGLLGATGTVSACGDDTPNAGGAAPGTDLGTGPSPASGTVRPGSRSPGAQPTTKSEVYSRGPEPRGASTPAPSTPAPSAPELAAPELGVPEPTPAPATGAEPTVVSRSGENLSTARQREGQGSGRPVASATPAPLPPGAFARTSEIPVGGGKAFKDQKVVVTQPVAGQFKGFSATCTHTGCLVDKVQGGQIICPCHGSRFSIVDGAVQKGPALLPLPGEKIAVGADGAISKS